MAFIPAGTEWFIGYLVTETVVDGHLAFVQIATTLIAASDPEEAYRKALLFGDRSNITFTNTDGDTVETTFLGLQELNVIHELLEDGAELDFTVRQDIQPGDLAGFVRQKHELAIFRPQE